MAKLSPAALAEQLRERAAEAFPRYRGSINDSGFSLTRERVWTERGLSIHATGRFTVQPDGSTLVEVKTRPTGECIFAFIALAAFMVWISSKAPMPVPILTVLFVMLLFTPLLGFIEATWEERLLQAKLKRVWSLV